MNIKHLGIFAVLGCIAMMGDGMAAGRSSMYSNIDMRNSGGNTIRISRGVETSYSDDYGYARRSNRSRMYGDNDAATQTQQHRYQRSERVAEQKTEPAAKRTYTSTSGQSTYTRTARRKYFLANPFYQPLQGQFGSVTTGEYMEGNYNFALTSGSVLDGLKAKREMTEWSIKEDLSYGITDRIALQGMVKYTNNRNKWNWDDPNIDDDKYKSSKIDLYGLGLQGRIVDTDDWIATLSGYYEHQKHGIDYFIADFKAGYKVSRSTIYGVLRGWLVNMEGDIYGDYMNNADNTEWGMLIYGDADKTLFMSELGLGVWSVLAEDWTLNVEGLYGFYDWHNQLSIKGAFGWQPNDWFALNLYAKTSLYDTADDDHADMYRQGNLPLTTDNWVAANVADVEISKYREWSVGLQVLFQF